MKYYLVNYLILEDRTVLENKAVYIPTHGFAGITDFRDSIAKGKSCPINPETIVIKSYLQVSRDEFNGIDSASA